MSDLSQWIGGDLSTDNTGDLATADGIPYGNQRVLRRLITPVNGYVWHVAPTDPYGAGLPSQIGKKRNESAINAIVLSQIFLEDCVAASPLPIVTLVDILNGVNVTVEYADANTGKPQSLSFNLSSMSGQPQ